MFEIVKKKILGPKVFLMDIIAPFVAEKAMPGQFLIVRADSEGERIPLTVCDFDREKGTVTIVYQTVGAETTRMSMLEEGDSFADVVGPLGNPSDLCDLPLEELKAKNILSNGFTITALRSIVSRVQGQRISSSLKTR